MWQALYGANLKINKSIEHIFLLLLYSHCTPDCSLISWVFVIKIVDDIKRDIINKMKMSFFLLIPFSIPGFWFSIEIITKMLQLIDSFKGLTSDKQSYLRQTLIIKIGLQITDVEGCWTGEELNSNWPELDLFKTIQNEKPQNIKTRSI